MKQCVILADSAASVPVELLAGLSQRDMPVRVVTDPASVMVELARRGAAAVLVAKGVWPDRVEALFGAIRRYHPQTGCWEFGEARNGLPRLIKLDPPKPPAEAKQAARNGDVRARIGSLAAYPARGPRADGPLLSDQELAMLLAPMGNEERA